MALAGHAERPPERVVEDHDVRPGRPQGLPYRPASERNPIPVGGRQLQRSQLVPARAVTLPLARDNEVMLERPGGGGKSRLLVEVRTDPAAPLRVEQRNVTHN